MSVTVESPSQKQVKYLVNPRDGKRRKMRVLRPVDETGLLWLNCLTTNALICCRYDEDTDTVSDARDVGDFGAPAPEEFRTYVPEESYEVGEFIYHQTWRDVGKVVRKRELPGGRRAIDVAFLNFGSKMLIVESTTFTR
jgi:hypothetical protein